MKDEREMMLSVAHSYQDSMAKSKIDEKYGEGAAEFFTEAMEAFYKIEERGAVSTPFAAANFNFLEGLNR